MTVQRRAPSRLPLRGAAVAALAAALVLRLLLTIATPAAAAQPFTALAIDSRPPDYIGGSALRVLKPPTYRFQASTSGRSLQFSVDPDPAVPAPESASPSASAPTTPAATDWVRGQLRTLQDPMTVGTYEGAERASFTVGNGIDVNAEHRGCNRTSGRFVIHELVAAADGTVERLAVSFEQHCEQGFGAFYGELRINSTVGFRALTGATGTWALPGGESRVLPFTNAGSLPVTMSAAIRGRDRAEFSVVADTCSAAPLAAGASCAIEVRARPTGAGERSADLVILDDTQRGRRVIGLTSTGLAPAGVAIRANQLVVPSGSSVLLTVDTPGISSGTIRLRTATAAVANVAIDSDGVTQVAVTLPVGSHWVNAVVSPTTGRAPATSPPLRLTVTP